MDMTPLKGICRCCLSEGKYKSMEYAPPPYSQSYTEMLNDILGYPLYNTGEVKLICGTCSNKLCQAVAFRKQVKSSENAFLAQLQLQKTEIKIEIKDEYLDDSDMNIPGAKIETISDDDLPQLVIAEEEIPTVFRKHRQKKGDIHNTASSDCAQTENIVSADQLFCETCKEYFVDKSIYKRHVHVCRRTCHSCKTQFKRVDILQRHKVSVHREGSVCNICDFVFTTENRLEKHQRQTHMKEKNVKCEHCEFEAFSKPHLAKHMRSHYNVRPYECRICKKKFKNSSNRNFHERIHTGDKRKVCQLCGEKFVQRASLKYHLEKHHPGDTHQP